VRRICIGKTRKQKPLKSGNRPRILLLSDNIRKRHESVKGSEKRDGRRSERVFLLVGERKKRTKKKRERRIK